MVPSMRNHLRWITCVVGCVALLFSSAALAAEDGASLYKQLCSSCHDSGLELIAWTVDELPEMRRLAALGVDGICTNDPRLFADLDR